MAKTLSTMLELGTVAPDFALPEPATGRTVARDELAAAPALLVCFLSNHCPYVKHIKPQLAALTSELIDRGVAVVAINANDVAVYPDDSPARMAEEVAAFGYRFAYLFDESQQVARAYRAACTPEFYLFDAGRRLVYRGQFDAARPGNDVPVTGADLRAAVDALLAGQPPLAQQHPSLGCNIKWRPGNAPDYFG